MTPCEQKVAIGELVEKHPKIEWHVTSPDGRGLVMAGESKKECQDWLDSLDETSTYKRWPIVQFKAYRNYLNDLNAMHEAENTLFGIERENYARMLTGAGLLFYPVAHATAAQRAEAFLTVKGLWK